MRYIQSPQSLEEVSVWSSGKDATDADQNEFILASQQETQSAVLPSSTACVAISPVGEVGVLYLSIPRNGPCDVDPDNVQFYLNDDTCTIRNSCGDNPRPGVPCFYPPHQAPDCENEEVSGPCIDRSDVQALVNVICAPDNATCNECINWETGSPTCTDYRTPLGVRIKMCVLENGRRCPWKKCCKKKLLDHDKCKVQQ